MAQFSLVRRDCLHTVSFYLHSYLQNSSCSSRVKAEGWLSCLSVCLFLSLTLPLSPLPFVVSGASPLAPPLEPMDEVEEDGLR